MAREITLAEVDQAEAALLEAKTAARAKGATDDDQATRKQAANDLVAVRSAYRRQEEAAGRRGGLVVGANKEG